MEYLIVKGIRLFAPRSSSDLINEAFNQKKILVAVNAEKVLMADRKFSKFISSNLGYPDGIGAVWLLKKHGYSFVKKIPGVELWLEIIKQRWRKNSFYLVGGQDEVIEATVRKLRREFPGINLLGYRNGFLSGRKDKDQLKQELVDKKPDVVFVAMGSPKQERLMEELHQEHPAVYQGLGGSFDIYIGKVERAPRWWLKNNLEWAYRLYKEPWRIKRQLRLIGFLKYLL
jgi:UDP-N-acetyl-D-mannosaminouronate:lipid I N-acetyl-D-mannosaminouronosyltransferase